MPEELPFHLKDVSYRIIGRPKLELQMTEMTEEIKQLRCEFESAWNHLKNAMALVYDGVYTEEQIDFAGMRAAVKEKHQALVDAGYGITELS